MGPKTGTDERYSVAMGDLWSGLARTLARLDVARRRARAARRRTARRTSLRRLQYALHLAARARLRARAAARRCEPLTRSSPTRSPARATRPPTSPRPSRSGAPTASTPLLHEWRGALFRVRLARLRLAAPAPRAVVVEEPVERDRRPAARRVRPGARRGARVRRGRDAAALAALGRRARGRVRLGGRVPALLGAPAPRPYPHGRLRRSFQRNDEPRLTCRAPRSASIDDHPASASDPPVPPEGWRAFQRALDPLAPPQPAQADNGAR